MKRTNPGRQSVIIGASTSLNPRAKHYREEVQDDRQAIMFSSQPARQIERHEEQPGGSCGDADRGL